MLLTKKISVTIMAMFSLVMLCSCKTADTLSANLYAQVESISDTQVVLDMGVWENGVFTSYDGENCIALKEIVSITNEKGEKLEYTDLQVGNILAVSYQTNVMTSESFVSVKVVQ